VLSHPKTEGSLTTWIYCGNGCARKEKIPRHQSQPYIWGIKKDYLCSQQTYKCRGDRARNSGPLTAATLPSESPYPTMKFALVLALVCLSSSTIASHGVVHQHRRTELAVQNTRGYDGWCQAHSGSASFTAYTDCSHPCKLRVYCFMV